MTTEAHLVMATQWVVSREAALNRWRRPDVKVTLHVSRLIRNETGQLVPIVHPEHDGKEFIGMDAANDYALSHGLLRYAEETQRSQDEIDELIRGVDLFGDVAGENQ
jgi:hypothetical protein